jgi:ComF family protein
MARAAGIVVRGATALLDLLLPPRCLVCSATTDAVGTLCAACWRGIVFIGPPCCAGCGLPFPYDSGADARCGACLAKAWSWERARSVMVYDDRSRRLVLALKHADRLHGAPAFGQWLARAGAELLADADLLVPVPLHWTRLWWRRYNQSAVLAMALQEVLRRQGKPKPSAVPDLLIRRRRTPSQGRRTPSQRLENVRGAFALRRGVQVKGRRIVLIDDVMTSGATVEECARVLRRGGAARVDVLTLARAVRTG